MVKATYEWQVYYLAIGEPGKREDMDPNDEKTKFYLQCGLIKPVAAKKVGRPKKDAE